ncbi:MAG: hypothetical protein LBN95_12080 [Prevotellaceae bacterium]|jgi:hypothetical protein|nr:hypothetical protein [Prevotellaceae bacterium]
MKKTDLLIIFALVLFGCENRYETRIWNQFPKEQFKNYFPYDLGTTIKFVSENNEIIEFPIKTNSFQYDPVIAAMDKKLRGECAVITILDSENVLTPTLFISAYIRNRHTLLIGFDITLPSERFRCQFVAFEEVDEENMPLDPNHIFTYLTDTVVMHNRNFEDVAYLVAGKGLVSFVDKDGVEWRAAE